MTPPTLSSPGRAVLLFVLAGCSAAPPTDDSAGLGAAWAPDADEGRLDTDAPGFAAGPGGYTATYGLMGARARFDADGARISAGNDVIGIRTVAWGREGEVKPAGPQAPVLGDCEASDLDPERDCIGRLAYPRQGITESWFSTPGRLAVAWDLATPPDGAGLVEIKVAVSGATVEPGAADDDAVLRAADHTVTFAGLQAWDDEGVALPASIELGPTGVSILVDDSGATWPIHVDPTTLVASWSTVGSTTGESWGGEVDGIGDVNGDGYADIAVGTYAYAGVGRVSVFYGSASGPATTASLTLLGTVTNGAFGLAVGAAGDVNGDGYDDMLVGARGSETVAGNAYLFLGSASGLPATASQSWGGAVGSYFGSDVNGAGDVNNDGYDDVVIGALGISSYTGKTYVYMGGPFGVSATPATTLTGPITYGTFGDAVAGAGDVNGDGYDDILVGACLDEDGGTAAGAAYLVLGAGL